MSTKPLHNYLRTHRKKVGFTQREVAFLLGSNRATQISLHEKSQALPKLRTIIAYEVIFNTKSKELFSGLFEEVKTETHQRIREVLKACARSRHKKLKPKKIEYLKGILKVNSAGTTK